MDNWYPMSKSMMEDSAEFRNLTPAEKVLWLSILSEVNLRGEFYKADLEWAVTLDLSLSKVRQARRKFQALGWLTVKPGYKAHDVRLATQYYSAKWAKPEKGVFFGQMPRYTWEWFLARLRHGFIGLPLGHDHLVVYAYLCYFWNKFGATSGVFIPKHVLQKVTNLPGIANKVESLAGASESLIEFSDAYHIIRLLKFGCWKEPSEHEAVAGWEAGDTEMLRLAIVKARERQRAKEKKQAKAKALRDSIWFTP